MMHIKNGKMDKTLLKINLLCLKAIFNISPFKRFNNKMGMRKTTKYILIALMSPFSFWKALIPNVKSDIAIPNKIAALVFMGFMGFAF